MHQATRFSVRKFFGGFADAKESEMIRARAKAIVFIVRSEVMFLDRLVVDVCFGKQSSPFGFDPVEESK